ncbi:MAG: RNA methyltransferase [Firmicutes bacterium]|nr:RNA methyltransferase [Bacillota bacterium]
MALISSPQNRQLKLYRSLEKRKYREELGLIPLEGQRIVGDVIKRGIFPEFILLRADIALSQLPFSGLLPADTVVYSVENKIFDRIAFTKTPQGVLAVCKRPRLPLSAVFAKKPAFILVADSIQDPGNLGTMIRSAAAAGAGGVVLLPGTVDATNPKAMRASMGAYFALPVVEATFAELQQALQLHGIDLVLADKSAALDYNDFDWTQPVAVVIGNEGSGISQKVKEAATTMVMIPMQQAVESLNAAIAMSVLFFEASRQRRLQ